MRRVKDTHADLKIELQRMWNVRVQIIPLIIGCLHGVCFSMFNEKSENFEHLLVPISCRRVPRSCSVPVIRFVTKLWNSFRTMFNCILMCTFIFTRCVGK